MIQINDIKYAWTGFSVEMGKSEQEVIARKIEKILLKLSILATVEVK